MLHVKEWKSNYLHMTNQVSHIQRMLEKYFQHFSVRKWKLNFMKEESDSKDPKENAICQQEF